MNIERGLTVRSVHPLVLEFYQRRRMQALGFVFDGKVLDDPERVQAFDLIVSAIGEAQRKAKPNQPRRG
jgi:hypothetical protein